MRQHRYLYKIFKMSIMRMAIISHQKWSGKWSKGQGKVSKKSANFEMDIEWQPRIV